MPTFCRHNRLIQNCPICAREQDVELRPIVTGPEGHAPARSGGAAAGGDHAGTTSRARTARPPAGVTVRRLQRGADDGYRSELAPGIKSSADAQRLAVELAFAAGRLTALATAPPGLYATVADPAGDIEERSWLAFEIAYLGPLDGEQPFAAIEQGRDDLGLGPGARARRARARPAHLARARPRDADPRCLPRLGGAGGLAVGGADRRAVVDPRAPLRPGVRAAGAPGLQRGAKFDLLTTLGCLGVYEMRAGSLFFSGSDAVTLAAKRLLGIGDPLLLDRRAAALAQACGIELEGLDVAFYNWERGERATLGVDPAVEPDSRTLEQAQAALGL